MSQLGIFDKENEPITNYLDYNEASHLLGISIATLRNWVKANQIKPVVNGTRKPLFLSEHIHSLKKRLAEGEINRLNSRANKRNSKSTFIPKEYLHDKQNYKKIEHVISLLKPYKLTTAATMLLISLNLLK